MDLGMTIRAQHNKILQGIVTPISPLTNVVDVQNFRRGVQAGLTHGPPSLNDPFPNGPRGQLPLVSFLFPGAVRTTRGLPVFGSALFTASETVLARQNQRVADHARGWFSARRPEAPP